MVFNAPRFGLNFALIEAMIRLKFKNHFRKSLALLFVAILVAPVWSMNRRQKHMQSRDEIAQRQLWLKAKSAILLDADGRIGDAFTPEKSLEKRVSFWFDIYGAYDDHHKVIHHNLYPWLVYEVVDARKVSGNIDVYMKSRMGLYKDLFRKLKKKKKSKDSVYTEIEQAYLDLLATAPNPDKALKTAVRKIRYQTGQRNQVFKGFERSQPFMQAMENEFESRGLPTELTRLPFVESSFHMDARSHVGAAGVWQFMRRTGRKFMRVNRRYDERLSPLKSTVAAAKLLKQNHRILYKEWPLAVTGYNYGPSGLRREVKKHGNKSLGYIIKTISDDRFSFASSNFYSCFLAILYVEKYKDIVFPKLELENDQPRLQKVKLRKRMHARKLIKSLKIDKAAFLHLNPDFRKAVTKNYKLPHGLEYYIPSEEQQLALDDHLDTSKVN